MISLRNVTHFYTGGEQRVRAVGSVSLEIPRRQFVALSGPSGCGKSTLMHLLGGLERPSAGEIEINSLRLDLADDRALTAYRRKELGLVFQFFNLLPTMNALENVSLPLLLQGKSRVESDARARELLELVGLTSRARHFAHQLSGGEQQRTAIARALVHRPALLIADEPTGNLDSAGAESVMELLTRIAASELATLIVVTHDAGIASAAARRLEMRDGKIISDHLSAATHGAPRA